MGLPSWCKTCRPRGVRCARCERRRQQQAASSARHYREKVKADPEKYAAHVRRARDGMSALATERWAAGKTWNGQPRTRPLGAKQTARVAEREDEMKRNPVPRCETCREAAKPCNVCRNARRREIYEMHHGPNTRAPRPRCAECPPYGNPCASCLRTYNAERAAERMASDPEYAARRKAIIDAANRRREEKNMATGGTKRKSKAKPPGEKLTPGRKPTRPRCENCPPKGDPCRTCLLAHRAKVHAERMENDPAYREARKALWATGNTQTGVADRIAQSKRAGAAAQTVPRCPECPPVGPPCKPCYNKHKRKSRGGTGERIARERARVIPKAPRQQTDVLTAVVPAATPLRDRSWELDTCVICMSKGRWGGRAACNRHADQVAPRAAGKGA